MIFFFFLAWTQICLLKAGYHFALYLGEGAWGGRRLEFLFIDTELYGRRLTRKMNGKVTGNHTYLNSASCVKHSREIRLQSSRLGMNPDPRKAKALLPLSER